LHEEFLQREKNKNGNNVLFFFAIDYPFNTMLKGETSIKNLHYHPSNYSNRILKNPTISKNDYIS